MRGTHDFLEHHDGALQKGSLGVLGKAASLGGDVAGVVLGSGVRDAASQAGRHGARRVYVWDDPALEAPLPQPRVDALAALVERTGAENVLFAASVLAADIAAGLAARLDAGLNWDLTDVESRDGELVGTRPALGDTVVAEVGWRTTPRLALFRAGTFDPAESGGEAAVEEFSAELQEFSTRARMIEQAHEETSGAAIEDADVIVAGGRGLGAPEGFRLAEELAQALGGSPDDWVRLREAWGDRFHERLRLIAERRMNLRVRMLGGTQVGYARMTRRWWTPVHDRLAEQGLNLSLIHI